MTTTNAIKIALYDDSQALRQSFNYLFSLHKEFEVTGIYPNARSILKETELNQPQVIVMDIDMPGITGIEATLLVREKFPEIKVLMLTVFDDDEKIFQSICAGAVGYILKNSSTENILEAIRQANIGGVPMTPAIASKVLQMVRLTKPILKNQEIKLSHREREILTHLTNGMSYKMISAAANISIDTVRFHIKNIYEALQVHSMSEAVSKAIKEKLV